MSKLIWQVRVVNYTGFARLRSVVNDAFSELAIHHFAASVQIQHNYLATTFKYCKFMIPIYINTSVFIV